MADNTEKKVLISVDVVDNFISAKKNVDLWNKALEDANKNKKTTAERQREINTELAKADNAYKKAKTAIENAAQSQEILNAVNQKVNKSLGEMQAELAALRNTPFDGLKPEDIKAVEQQMANLTSGIQDYENRIKTLDSGAVLKNTADGLQAIFSGVQTLTSGLSAMGVESESLKQLEETTTSLITSTQALAVVSEYLEKKKYQLIGANIKNIATLTAEKVAMGASAVATFLMGKATDTTSLSFKALRGAIISTGIGALVVLVGLLISNWDNLVGWFKKGTDGMSGFGKAFDTVKEIAMGVFEVVKNYVLMPFQALGKIMSGDFKGAMDEIINGYNIIGNFQKGANEQMVQNEEDRARRATEAQRAQRSENLFIEAEKLEKALEVNKAMGASAESLYKQEMDILDKKVQGYRLALMNISDTNSEEYKNLQKQLDDTEQSKKVRQATETKRISDAGVNNAKKKQDQFLKELDLQAKYEEAKLKAEAKYQSEDFASKQAYEARSFNLKNDNLKKKLDAEFSFNRITEVEHKKQIAIIEQQEIEFKNKQAADTNKYYDERRKTILDLVTKEVDEQKDLIDKKYNDLLRDMASMSEPVKLIGETDEEYEAEYLKFIQFENDKQLYIKDLNKQRAKEQEEVDKNSLAKKLSNIEDEIKNKYKKDFAKFTDNEREKTKVEIESLKDSIKRKQDAGIDASEDEAKLRSAEMKLNQIVLDTDLLKAGESAKAKYEARKAFLLKEQELYKDNADVEEKIKNELKENDKAFAKQKLDAFLEYANASMGIMNAISGFASQLEANELTEYEEANQTKKQDLENRLNQGLISQSEYDRGVLQADKELDKQKAEIARKAAVREKAIKIFEVGLNTASAILKNTAQLGFLPAIPVNIMTGVLGAVQLATILATPLPKASKGMLLNGKSHAQGGIPIEAEGGEAIINKQSTRMFAPLLSAMNVAGGGVPFVRAGSDGGFSARMAMGNSLTAQDVENAMAQAVSNIKIYTTVEDIRRGESNYANVVDRSSY